MLSLFYLPYKYNFYQYLRNLGLDELLGDKLLGIVMHYWFMMLLIFIMLSDFF